MAFRALLFFMVSSADASLFILGSGAPGVPPFNINNPGMLQQHTVRADSCHHATERQLTACLFAQFQVTMRVELWDIIYSTNLEGAKCLYKEGSYLLYWRALIKETGALIYTRVYGDPQTHATLQVTGCIEIVNWLLNGLHQCDPTHTHMCAGMNPVWTPGPVFPVVFSATYSVMHGFPPVCPSQAYYDWAMHGINLAPCAPIVMIPVLHLGMHSSLVVPQDPDMPSEHADDLVDAMAQLQCIDRDLALNSAHGEPASHMLRVSECVSIFLSLFLLRSEQP